MSESGKQLRAAIGKRDQHALKAAIAYAKRVEQALGADTAELSLGETLQGVDLQLLNEACEMFEAIAPLQALLASHEQPKCCCVAM